MLTCLASGADQLKEERRRYNATAEPETADEQSGDCWDVSSEDEYISASPTLSHHSHFSKVAVAASAAGQGADLPAEIDGQQTLSCHQNLLQHTALTEAVKQMLHQDGAVRNIRWQPMTGFAPCLHPTTAFCGM